MSKMSFFKNETRLFEVNKRVTNGFFEYEKTYSLIAIAIRRTDASNVGHGLLGRTEVN